MARRATRSRKVRKDGIKVDFTGVEGRRTVLIPDDDYAVAVEEIKKDTSEAGNDNLVWSFKTMHDDPKLDDVTLWYNTSLLPQSLWNLRNLLETLGVEVPDGPLDIDFKELVGLEMMAVVEAEKFEGKKRSKIVDFYPMEDDSDQVEIQEEEGVEGMTEEEVMELKAADMDDVVEKYDLDVNLKKARSLKKKREAILDAMETAGFLVEEVDEEDDKSKLTVDEVSDMKEAELEDVVDKYELDLDLKKFKTKRKKANAVIDTLEEAGFLAEEE